MKSLDIISGAAIKADNNVVVISALDDSMKIRATVNEVERYRNETGFELEDHSPAWLVNHFFLWIDNPKDYKQPTY